MKKVLMLIGAFSLLLAVGVACFVGYVAYQGSRLDTSSKEYVDRSVPVVVRTWSKDELLKLASTQLREAVSDAQFESLFVKLSTLGRLEHYDGSTGESNISVTTQNGKVVTALYVANATFEKSTAQITVRLIQDKTGWKILLFNVTSPLFVS